MNLATVFRLLVNRRGLLSNLESIVGAAVAGIGLLIASRFGVAISEEVAFAVVGGGVALGNQLLGGLDFFKRFDAKERATFDLLSGRGPGTSDSMDEGRR